MQDTLNILKYGRAAEHLRLQQQYIRVKGSHTTSCASCLEQLNVLRLHNRRENLYGRFI